MKSIKSILKSLKILARSRSSAVIVLLVPLLIVLVVGLGFLDTGDSTLNIGVITEESNNLTARYIDGLQSPTNNLIDYNSIDDCVLAIQESVVLSCIYFPGDFDIDSDNASEIDFYVDESRINLVYRLINSISSNVQGETTEITEEITQQILEVLSRSTNVVDNNIEFADNLEGDVADLISDVSSDEKSLSNLDSNSLDVSISSPTGSADDVISAYESLLSRAKSAESAGRSFLSANPGNSTDHVNFEDALNKLEDRIDDEDSVQGEIEDLESSLDDIQDGISDLESNLDSVLLAASDVASNLQGSSDSLAEMQTEILEFKSDQEALKADLLSAQSRQAGDITSPVTTNIKTVSPEYNLLTFSFPYLLVLVMLLVGIMLASTLVFIEKDSKAFFRNFTTPTSEAFFMSINFFSALIIVLFQVIVIMTGAYYLLDVPILNNLEITALALFLGMSMFIFIGMLVGELFNTSEAITMVSIGLGSVFMFMSNLVLPLETLGESIKQISMYNPYVLVSEAVRGSLLFEMSLLSLAGELFLITVYSVVLLILIIAIRKIKAIKYLYGFKKNRGVIDSNALNINGQDVHTIDQCIVALKNCSDEDYKGLTQNDNKISNWLENVVANKYLAIRVKNKSREEAIELLEQSLKDKK